MRSSNHRASFAVIVGLLAAATVPAAIVFVRRTNGYTTLDAAWAIPVAVVLGAVALLLARGARGRIRWTLERAGGRGRIRLGRVLAVIGLCCACSGSIAVGVYELLLRLEG